MNPFPTTPILLTFACGFVAAQEIPPKPVDTAVAVAHRQAMLRCKASQLIGCAVTNSKNESLGEIQDIVLDSGNHRIAYAVVAFGGTLGMGAKYFALPWRLIEIAQRSSDDSPRATLGLDRETLKQAPGFDKTNWPDMANPSWAGQVEDYYRARNEGGAPIGAAEPKGSGKDGSSGHARAPDSAAFAPRRLTQIIGTRVLDAANARIADVEDLVVDSRLARIDGVLLSFGGVLGIGESVALVPADALTYDSGRKAYLLPCSTERLAAMALKGGKWPALNDEAWLVSGRASCLIARKESDTKKSTAVDATVSAAGMAAAVYDLAKVEKLSGTILTVGSVVSEHASQELVRLRVRVTDGREIIVHAGPSSFAPQQRLDLRPDRRIEITGAPTVIDQRTVVLAGELKVDDKTVSLRDANGDPTWLEGK